jgi:WXG100 protein secretion system (Wss), protein YukD
MTVVLVTVAGLSGRRDLAVPADVPVGDLLEPIAAALAEGRPGGTGRARRRLGLLGGDPLPPERSLISCGVGDGAILTLEADPPPTTTRPPLPGAATPRPRRCVVVGVVSAGAGVGRATVAALLAAVLAAARQGLTVAVDAQPGPGSLGDRLAPDLDVPAGELLGLLDHPALTAGELTACLTGREDRPALVTVGRGSRAPDRRAWTLLVQGLARHAGALVVDCGRGLGGAGARAAVAAADQLVLVTEPAPSPQSRRIAAALVDLGHAVVVAGASLAGGSGSAAASGVLPGVRGVVPLPRPALATPREWAEVPPWWRRPARQLADLLAADWPALGMPPRPPRG